MAGSCEGAAFAFGVAAPLRYELTASQPPEQPQQWEKVLPLAWHCCFPRGDHILRIFGNRKDCVRDWSPATGRATLPVHPRRSVKVGASDARSRGPSGVFCQQSCRLGTRSAHGYRGAPKGASVPGWHSSV